MKISTVLLAAAMGGALVGAVGCGEATPPAAAPSGPGAGSMPSTSGAPAAPGAKHACKGQNGCKGQGFTMQKSADECATAQKAAKS